MFNEIIQMKEPKKEITNQDGKRFFKLFLVEYAKNIANK
jgi:hypothetical protein